MYDIYWHYDNDEQFVSVDTIQANSGEDAERSCQKCYGDRNVDFGDVIVIRVDCLEE